jgi:CHAD domain-containing protein
MIPSLGPENETRALAKLQRKSTTSAHDQTRLLPPPSAANDYGATLKDSFTNAIDRMRTSAEDSERHPVRALKAFRVEGRRARALCRLVQPVIPQSGATLKQIDKTIRDLVRPTSALRDADVLNSEQRTAPDDDRARTLTRTVGPLGRLQREFQNAFDALDGERIRDALEQSLITVAQLGWRAEARHKALSSKNAKAKCKAEALVHDWRKRIKELRYQTLALLPDGQAITQEQRRLSAQLKKMKDDLGRVTDSWVERDALATKQGKKRKTSKKRAARMEKLASNSDKYFRRALRTTHDLFGEAPVDGGADSDQVSALPVKAVAKRHAATVFPT